jgi:CBS domain-containing protein
MTEQMSGSGRELKGLTVWDVVAAREERDLPAVGIGASIREVVTAMCVHRHSRVLYVTAEDGTLAGVISLEKMAGHVFSHGHHDMVNPRHLMSLVTTETAGEMMKKEPVFAREDEDMEEVLKRMLGKDLSEIPVVDGENRLTADITLVDIMKTMLS